MNVMNRSSALHKLNLSSFFFHSPWALSQMIVLINSILFEKHSIGLSRYPFADLVNTELHTLL